MSTQNPTPTPGDPPIIIQGSSSVIITVPPTFTEQGDGTSQQASTGKGKNFGNGNVHLVSLQIDENTPIPLNKNSKITIIYK